MKKLAVFTLILFVLTACAAPAAPPEFPLEGDWHYIMIETGTGNTYDEGTLSFPAGANGAFTYIGYYGYEFEGEFAIDGANFTLTDLNWQGQFENANSLSGTWRNAEEDTGGTFTAIKK